MNLLITISITLLIFFIVIFMKYLRLLRSVQARIEGTYLRRCVKLDIGGKKITVIFFLPYDHHLVHFGQEKWTGDIRDHLLISGYGEPGFENSAWREHLQKHGYENARIQERAL